MNIRENGLILAAATLFGGGMASSDAQAALNFTTNAYVTPVQYLGPGPAGRSTIPADVNGDGWDDIVIANWGTPGFGVLLNDKTGHFGSALAPKYVWNFTSFITQSIGAGDFDGDGIIDIAAASWIDLSIMKGRGDGTFVKTGSHFLLIGGQVQSYVLDINGDGHLDIVAGTLFKPALDPDSQSGPGIQTFLGNGDGTFRDGPLTPRLAVITALAPANLNGDGIPDIATMEAIGLPPAPGNPLHSMATAFLGNGDGSFTRAGSAETGYVGEDIAAADLNGDGIDDVATADSFSFLDFTGPTMSVALSDGSGGFSSTRNYPTEIGPVSAGFADMDGNGTNDLISTGVILAGVQIYSNDGTGKFSLAKRLQASFGPQTPAIADYDRNGKPDIAVAGPFVVTVLLNKSTP